MAAHDVRAWSPDQAACGACAGMAWARRPGGQHAAEGPYDTFYFIDTVRPALDSRTGWTRRVPHPYWLDTLRPALGSRASSLCALWPWPPCAPPLTSSPFSATGAADG